MSCKAILYDKDKAISHFITEHSPLMNKGLTVSSYVRKRPRQKISLKEFSECINIMARNEHSRTYESIRKELADKQNQFVLLRKFKKLIGFIVFEGKQDTS
jgi:hypothetical protein